jgi:hypothetical protein
MMPQRWNGSSPGANAARVPVSGLPASAARGASAAAAIDWPEWLRTAERKRRLLARQESRSSRPFWSSYVVAATDASFRLDGLIVPRADLASSLARGWAGRRRSLNSRQQQRVRNHVALLHSIERLLMRGDALKPADVVRWYTSVACGLSTTQLDEPTATRLDGIVRQINSPHLRLCPALQGIARLHRQLLADPVVPSFNGTLARLLLRYQLGRCGLPPVVFDPESDAGVMLDEPRLLARLLVLIDATYDVMLAKA